MPCTYTLHEDINILHCWLKGKPSLRDILILFDETTSDPNNLDSTNLIIDFVKMREIGFNDVEEQQLISILIGVSLRRNFKKKCALLADREPGWSLAGRVEAGMAQKSLVEFKRFRDPAEALKFVGVNRPVELGRLGFTDDNEYS